MQALKNKTFILTLVLLYTFISHTYKSLELHVWTHEKEGFLYQMTEYYIDKEGYFTETVYRL